MTNLYLNPMNISIHAPRTGSDKASVLPAARNTHFNPRSPHGERRRRSGCWISRAKISIHAPRTGSDPILARVRQRLRVISIHAPRTGSDSGGSCRCCPPTRFQSTLPARGATAPTRSSRSSTITFQSTLPARGATPRGGRTRRRNGISIHAPRTGSDRKGQENDRRTTDFNPRSPHGERQSTRPRCAARRAFQSTLPARGATSRTPGKAENGHEFQSTLPARGATAVAHRKVRDFL